MKFAKRYEFDAYVLVRAKVTVLGNDVDDAKNRLEEGAWHGVVPNFDQAQVARYDDAPKESPRSEREPGCAIDHDGPCNVECTY